MSWRWSIASGLLALSLTGCLVKSDDKIARELEQSVVLITYRDKPGHGTGFFVPGAKGICTVLTAKHVLAPSSDLNLTLDREIISSDTNIQPLRGVDLAVVTFKPSKSKNCPYKPLKLGNSDRVEYGEPISIFGFPKREGDRKGLLGFFSCPVRLASFPGSTPFPRSQVQLLSLVPRFNPFPSFPGKRDYYFPSFPGSTSFPRSQPETGNEIIIFPRSQV
ncbi:MAG: trypsin-like peptidase domain-containing protein [Hormoscilla sp. GM7CHS1pb]|nr:trypsin-like peptidase domain-containing protein [Hormoscilla sp. GM7CHS1pb]